MSVLFGCICIGIGGWVFLVWCGGMFYLFGLFQCDELVYVSCVFGCIEINSIFYCVQKLVVYVQWCEQILAGFWFLVKVLCIIIQIYDLGMVGVCVDVFVEGIVVLGDWLGLLVWQFGDSYLVDVEVFDVFLQCFLCEVGGVCLQYVLEVCNLVVWMLVLIVIVCVYGIVLVYSGLVDYFSFVDFIVDFIYVWLMYVCGNLCVGYFECVLEQWCLCVMCWVCGEDNFDLLYVVVDVLLVVFCDVYVVFIGVVKQCNFGVVMVLCDQLWWVGVF